MATFGGVYQRVCVIHVYFVVFYIVNQNLHSTIKKYE